MKKALILGVSSMLALGSLGGVMTPTAHASENSSNEVTNSPYEVTKSFAPVELTNELTKVSPEESSALISEVEPYVHKNDQGLLYVDSSIPSEIYNKHNVALLEKSFEEINAKVEKGFVTVNNDLSITPTFFQAFAKKERNYTSETFWWGERGTYTNAQAKEAAQQVNTAAIDVAYIGALTAWIPGFAITIGITSAYLFKLSNDINVANKGKGIILDMNWTLTYSISSR